LSAEFASTVLSRLVRGSDLNRDEAREALGQILSGAVEPAQIAAFLTALTIKGETVDEMTGFIDAMMNAAIRTTVSDECVDIVGTGGDQLHSVNISTMAAFAVAGTGVPVAKHGNRSATSSVGSADVLEGLGVKIDIDGDTVRRSIDEANFGFFFAPVFHHALGQMAPIRKVLGFRTIFNMLGPLANPAQVRQTVVGVAQEHLLEPMAHVLLARGVQSAVLVRGDDGLDELSLSGPSTLYIVTPESSTRETMDAGTILGRHHSLDEMRGGDTAVNVSVFRSFLDGQQGPVFDVACANAALALRAAKRCHTLEEGFAMAAEAVLSGRARQSLERTIEVTNA
jgi:anthranilate phosphoribosyltransferase